MVTRTGQGENFREILTGILSAYEIGMLVNPNHSMMSYADLLNNWHPAFMAAEVVNGKIMGNVVPIIQVEHEIRQAQVRLHLRRQALSGG